jgi:hypothetical protein
MGGLRLSPPSVVNCSDGMTTHREAVRARLVMELGGWRYQISHVPV